MTLTIEMATLDPSVGDASTSETTSTSSPNQCPRATSPFSVNLTSLTSQPQSTVLPTSKSILKKDSAYKTTIESEPSSSKTPRPPSVSGIYTKSFRLNTCCGILELSCLKLTSFVALLFSLFAFASLVVFISLNFAIVNDFHESLESLETTGAYYRELMKLSCRAAVTSQYNRTLSLEYVQIYQVRLLKYYEVMNKLFTTVPPELLYWNQQHMLREDIKSRRAVVMELDMISNVTSGNYTTALNDLDSDHYRYLLTGFEEEVHYI